MADELLTPSEAAQRLKISKYTVLRWAREGKLDTWKEGKTVRFYADRLTPKKAS